MQKMRWLELVMDYSGSRHG